MSTNLKQARLDLGYSIKEVSEYLKIRKKYLIALEEGKYDLLPGNAYVIGYLKSYSKFLKIKIEDIDITSQDKINMANVETKNSKAQNYLLIISVLILTIVVIVYYQIFSTKDEEVIITHPDSKQLNLNDKYGYK